LVSALCEGLGNQSFPSPSPPPPLPPLSSPLCFALLIFCFSVPFLLLLAYMFF
jgi:hypothetical protein